MSVRCRVKVANKFHRQLIEAASRFLFYLYLLGVNHMMHDYQTTIFLKAETMKNIYCHFYTKSNYQLVR